MKVQEYDLPFTTGRVTFPMPMGAEILTAKEQHNRPVLRVLIDPEATKISRVFQVVQTGKEVVDEPMEYVGTVQLDGGAKVLDVFEVLT